MKIIETAVYSFNELNPEAQQTAIDNYRNNGIYTQYNWDEAHKSVKEFCKVFNVSTGSRSWLDVYTGQVDDNILELKGLRLRTYLINNFWSQIYTPKYLKHSELRTEAPTKWHRMRGYRKIEQGPNKGLISVTYYSSLKREYSCPLTGVTWDMDLLDPIVKFIDKYREYPSAEYQTFKDLLEDGFSGLKKTLEDEDEYKNSDEAIREDLENNENEYTEDGEEF